MLEFHYKITDKNPLFPLLCDLLFLSVLCEKSLEKFLGVVK